MSTLPGCTWGAELEGYCFEDQEDHGPETSQGTSTHLGELFTHIVRMADVVKQVKTEVAQLQQENKALRKQQMLAAGQERALRVAAASTDSAAFQAGKEPSPPDAVETPHAPTEPPPDLGEGQDLCLSSTATRHSKKQVHADVAEEAEEPRKSLLSLKSDTTASTAADKSDIKTQVKKTLRRQHTFEPKTKAKKSQLAWISGLGEDGTASGARQSQILTGSSEKAVGLRAMLFDPEAVKQKMKDKLTKPEFNIAKFYSRTGFAQRIARSNMFESITLAIIFMNTIWIAVDTEHNKADVLLDAAVSFQIIEHCFCSFFVLELMLRFAAFQKKRDCFRSGWFLFESALVTLMVFEDWIMTLILLAGTDSGRGRTGVGVIKDAAILRILRLLRLARLGRAVKLMRQSPEIMIMVKAVAASARSVLWTCVLLACLMFFFGVCFTQICKDSSLEAEYFGSLTSSLHTLMIAGLFPDLEIMSRTINKAHFVYWSIFVVYLVMTGITVMNLLIGVLVEVAQSSARIERDNLDVSYVKDIFVTTLCLEEVEDFGVISVAQAEFVDLLQEPEILKALTKVGIDVFGLIDLMEFIFMSGPVGFVELLEVVLQLRSGADVTVRDVVEVRKFLTYEISKLKLEFTQLGVDVRACMNRHLK